MTRLLLSLLSLSAPGAAALVAQPAAPAARFEPQVVADHLETVWSLAFAPDGRLFVTERPGRIRVVRNGMLAPDPWATIAVHESARAGIGAGLMGLAVAPAFERNRRVYVCYTHPGPPLVNRIAVLTEVNGTGTRLTTLVDGMMAGS